MQFVLLIGYNNPVVREDIVGHSSVTLLSSRPAMGIVPPGGYINQLQETLLSVSELHYNITLLSLLSSFI